MNQAVMLGLRVQEQLMPSEALRRRELSQTEKVALLWFALMSKGLDAIPADKDFSKCIKEILYTSPLYGTKLNVMRVFVTMKMPSGSPSQSPNRSILSLLCKLEKGEFNEVSSLFLSFVNSNKLRAPQEWAQVSCLPTMKMPSRAFNYPIEVHLSNAVESPSKDFDNKLEFFRKAQALFDLALIDVEEVEGVAERVSKLRMVADQYFEIEKFYHHLVKEKNPAAYFSMQRFVHDYSDREFIELAKELNAILIEQSYSEYDELVSAQNLFVSVADAFFNTVKEELDLSCEFIRALEDRIQVRSNYFSPLDVFRMWWMEVYLKSNLEKARDTNTKIVDICLILRSFASGRGVRNILNKDLNHIRTKLNEIKQSGEARYAEEQFELIDKLINGRAFPTILLHWLDAPLLYMPKDQNTDAREAELFNKLETQWNLRMSSIGRIGGDPVKGINKVRLAQRVKKGDLSCLGILEGANTLREKARNIGLYFGKEYSFTEAVLTAESSATKMKVAPVNIMNSIIHYQAAFHVYLYPLFKYGKELLEEVHDKSLNQVEIKFSTEAFSQVLSLRKLSPQQKRLLDELSSLLEAPIFPYAIYQKMAHVLEAFNPQSGASHSLRGLLKSKDTSLSVFLGKMEEFLPNMAFKPSISLEQLSVDIECFCKVLGVQTFPVPSNQMDVELRVESTKQFQEQFALFSRLQRIVDENFARNLKDMDSYPFVVEKNRILEALPALFKELDKLLSVVDARAVSPAEAGYFIFTAGRIVEYGLKLLIFKHYNANFSEIKKIQIENRELLHSHLVYTIYKQCKEMMPPLSQDEEKALEQWNGYSNTARYPKLKSKASLDRYVVNGLQEKDREVFKERIEILMSITMKVMMALNS